IRFPKLANTLSKHVLKHQVCSLHVLAFFTNNGHRDPHCLQWSALPYPPHGCQRAHQLIREIGSFLVGHELGQELQHAHHDACWSVLARGFIDENDDLGRSMAEQPEPLLVDLCPFNDGLEKPPGARRGVWRVLARRTLAVGRCWLVKNGWKSEGEKPADAAAREGSPPAKHVRHERGRVV